MVKDRPRILQRDFFLSEDVVQISQALLGKRLVTRLQGVRTSGVIVETEAYKAPEDKASHAYNGRRTARTEVMYWQGGTAYVYLCYGIHHLFNVVTGPVDVAHAILIRAVEPEEHTDIMLNRRGFQNVKPQLTAGPGVMSKALGITSELTGIDMLAADSPVWIEDTGKTIQQSAILASPRVGVAYAEECAAWNWRFRVAGSPWTSKAK